MSALHRLNDTIATRVGARPDTSWTAKLLAKGGINGRYFSLLPNIFLLKQPPARRCRTRPVPARRFRIARLRICSWFPPDEPLLECDASNRITHGAARSVRQPGRGVERKPCSPNWLFQTLLPLRRSKPAATPSRASCIRSPLGVCSRGQNSCAEPWVTPRSGCWPGHCEPGSSDIKAAGMLLPSASCCRG